MKVNPSNDLFKYGDLVSVVVPTYKRDDKFRRAIDSIKKQTYKNLEVIVVDDNADHPGYRKRVEDIIGEYDSIELVQNAKNLGGAISRNVGIRKASGKMLAFLDDDDEWREDKIEKQCKKFCELSDPKIGAIICNNNWLKIGENIIYQHMCKILATTSNWLVPKGVIEKVGLFEATPNEQDTILLLKIMLAGYRIYNFPEDLVVRHFHDKADGISGAKLKNTIGTGRLRKLCRENYDKLDNKKQIADVEHCLSSKLMDMYIYNHKIDEAKKEFRIMIKTGPFRKDTLKAFAKIYCHKLFSAVKGVR